MFLFFFYFLFFFNLEISADSDYSHKIVRCLPLGRKAMTNLVYKKAETLLLTKIRIYLAMVFSVAMDVMVGCESWTIKKVEH